MIIAVNLPGFPLANYLKGLINIYSVTLLILFLLRQVILTYNFAIFQIVYFDTLSLDLYNIPAIKLSILIQTTNSKTNIIIHLIYVNKYEFLVGYMTGLL